MNEMVTEVAVLYRDAVNYKQSATYVFAGAPTDAEINALVDALDEGIFFIPTQVGCPHLGENGYDSFPTEDDHVWHELDPDAIVIRPASRGDALEERTVSQFIAAVVAAARDGWDVAAATDGLEAAA